MIDATVILFNLLSGSFVVVMILFEAMTCSQRQIRHTDLLWVRVHVCEFYFTRIQSLTELCIYKAPTITTTQSISDCTCTHPRDISPSNNSAVPHPPAELLLQDSQFPPRRDLAGATHREAAVVAAPKVGIQTIVRRNPRRIIHRFAEPDKPPPVAQHTKHAP